MTRNVESIQREMQDVRGQLDADVGLLCQNARRMVDWRRLAKKHPWTTLGAAAAVGFLVIPRRRESVRVDAEALAELARQHQLVLKFDGNPREIHGGLTAGLVALAVAAARRGATAWASRQLGQLVESWGSRASPAAGQNR
jgi:hypothetical protein